MIRQELLDLRERLDHLLDDRGKRSDLGVQHQEAVTLHALCAKARKEDGPSFSPEESEHLQETLDVLLEDFFEIRPIRKEA